MLRFTTEIGTCGVEWDSDGITRVHLPRMRALQNGRESDPASVPPAVRAAAEAMTRLLAGEPEDLRDVVLSPAGVEPFAARVYAAAREIDPGAIVTYGEIARGLGGAGGAGYARAVGAALGNNPYPIVVPCHRVLAADGSLHGFSAPGGIATKRRMLELEGAPGFRQQPLFV